MDIALWAIPPLLSLKPLPLPPWSRLFGYEWGVISLEAQGPQGAGVKSAMPGLVHLTPSLGTGSPCCLGLFSSLHSTQNQEQIRKVFMASSLLIPDPPILLLPYTVSKFPITWFLSPLIWNPSTWTHLRRSWTESTASWGTAFFLNTFYSRAEV